MEKSTGVGHLKSICESKALVEKIHIQEYHNSLESRKSQKCFFKSFLWLLHERNKPRKLSVIWSILGRIFLRVFMKSCFFPLLNKIMEEKVFLWKCQKVRNAGFPGISCRNSRGKVFPCVIPLQKNGCGKALLFLPKPELHFPSKIWLKLNFVGLFCSYQKSISNPSPREISAVLPNFPLSPNPITASTEKPQLGSKISSQQKNTFPAIPKWNKRGKHGMQGWEIQLPCGPACVTVGFQDGFIPWFWLGVSWWNVLKLESEGWALCGDEMFTSPELLQWMIVFIMWGVWD